MTTGTRDGNGAARVTKTIDVARVTIELCSPLTIGAGAPDDIIDSVCVLDANGLPTLPGASLAGMIRDRWRATGGTAVTGVAETAVFGTRIGSDGDDGKASGTEGNGKAGGSAPRIRSRFMTSWGHIHDHENRPVCRLMLPDAVEADAVLRGARSPIVRQHVRLNARGAADTAKRGLFDEQVVALGHRFTFEVVAEDLPPAVMDHVLGILASPAARIGGKSRRGMGRFRLVGGTVQRRRFDLGERGDFDAYASLPVDLSQSVPAGVLAEERVDALATGGEAVATLSLMPRGFWMMGGGTSMPDAAGVDAGAGIDLLPYREPMVRWDGNGGTFDLAERWVVVPATGIKGALRHRATFHANVKAKVFADQMGSAQKTVREAVEQDLRCLFGHVAQEKVADEKDQVSAGRVIIDDVVLPASPPAAVVNHVSLDRFTSGPLDGHLFAEAPLWKLAGEAGDGGGDTAGGAGRAGEAGRITVTVLVRDAGNVPDLARAGLAAALDDLAAGRLQIGAGSGRGNGWFEGTVTWSPPGWAGKETPAEGGEA